MTGAAARLIAATVTTLLAVLAAAAAWAAWRNLHRARSWRQCDPLNHHEVLAAPVPASGTTPTGWPVPEALNEPRLAAAYRDYARERRDTLRLAGDVVVLAAGACLGAAVPTALRTGWAMWPAGASLLVGVAGFGMRMRSEQHWVAVVRAYEARCQALTTQPDLDPPDATIPAALLRAVRRRRRRSPSPPR